MNHVTLIALAVWIAVSGAAPSYRQQAKLHEAASVLDAGVQAEIVSNVMRLRANKGVLWILNRPALAEHFDEVVVMRDGRSTESGEFAELNKNGGALTELLKSAA